MTPKQTAFVDEYLLDLNATQAAIRAGYSAKTARAIAAALLTKVDIQAAVAAAQAARSERTELSADWVIGRLRREAEAAGDGTSHAARVRALELLGKHLGLFVDRVQVGGTTVLEIVEEIVDSPAGRPG